MAVNLENNRMFHVQDTQTQRCVCLFCWTGLTGFHLCTRHEAVIRRPPSDALASRHFYSRAMQYGSIHKQYVCLCALHSSRVLPPTASAYYDLFSRRGAPSNSFQNTFLYIYIYFFPSPAVKFCGAGGHRDEPVGDVLPGVAARSRRQW